ncbi:MAG: hypothetical protein OEW24_03395 [Chloroflexota bacterium]|nr:hypothetical protein [Chloroflexota bacterium]
MSDDWIRESTSLDPSTHHHPDYYPDHWGQIVYADGGGYYKYMWHGALRDTGEYDFYAVGDHGQYLYVSPAAHMVIEQRHRIRHAERRVDRRVLRLRGG